VNAHPRAMPWGDLWRSRSGRRGEGATSFSPTSSSASGRCFFLPCSVFGICFNRSLDQAGLLQRLLLSGIHDQRSRVPCLKRTASLQEQADGAAVLSGFDSYRGGHRSSLVRSAYSPGSYFYVSTWYRAIPRIEAERRLGLALPGGLNARPACRALTWPRLGSYVRLCRNWPRNRHAGGNSPSAISSSRSSMRNGSLILSNSTVIRPIGVTPIR
jgi:hypothetical protein